MSEVEKLSDKPNKQLNIAAFQNQKLPFHHTQAVAPSTHGDAIWSVKRKGGRGWKGKGRVGGKAGEKM